MLKNQHSNFIKDLKALDFSFKAFVMEDESIQADLEREYLKTEKIPRIDLYLNIMLGEKNIQEWIRLGEEMKPATEPRIGRNQKEAKPVGSAELKERYEKSLNSPYNIFKEKYSIKKDEFYDRLRSNDLPEECYGHDLKKTSIVTTLFKVKRLIDSSENRNFEELKPIAKKIKSLISEISNEKLRERLLERLSDIDYPFWLSEFVEKRKQSKAENFHSLFEAPQPENQKPEISLEAFFPKLTSTQVQNIKNKFEKKKGAEMACMIHYARKKRILNIVKGNSDYSLSNFIRLFSQENILEGVRKQFKPATDYTLRDEFKEKEYQIREKIDEALKVG